MPGYYDEFGTWVDVGGFEIPIAPAETTVTTLPVATVLPSPSSQLQSNAIFKGVDLVSEGEIDGLVDGLKSVYLDGVPIRHGIDGSYNYQNVVLRERKGTSDQTHHPQPQYALFHCPPLLSPLPQIASPRCSGE